MTKYITQERAPYWPVFAELMAQYCDGSHTCLRLGIHNIYEWWQRGQRHRDGDKPAKICSNISFEWYQNSQAHRNGDKPAYIDSNGRLEWCQNGQTHRICGPAIISSDDKFFWFIYDEDITQEVNDWLNGEEWQGTPLQIFEFQLRFL